MGKSHEGQCARSGAKIPAMLSAAFAALLAGSLAGAHAQADRRAADADLTTKPLAQLPTQPLDTPWPKVVRSRRRLLDLLGSGSLTIDTLFDLLADRCPASAAEAPESRLPFELDGPASAPFIVMPDYGTRCSTAIVCRADGHIEVAERRFDAAGELTGESRFVFVARNWLP